MRERACGVRGGVRAVQGLIASGERWAAAEELKEGQWGPRPGAGAGAGAGVRGSGRRRAEEGAAGESELRWGQGGRGVCQAPVRPRLGAAPQAGGDRAAARAVADRPFELLIPR